MGIFDGMYRRLADAVAARVLGDAASNAALVAREYRVGVQKRQLRTRPGQFDDNLTVNLCGVIIDRAVSELVGREIQFNFEGGPELVETEPTRKTEQEVWLDACLSANHWDILRHRMAMAAAESGTGYVTFAYAADGSQGMVGEDGVVYPRIVLMSPEYMSIQTLPDDWEIVSSYTMQYKTTGLDGKELARKRIFELDPETGRWTITTYESRTTSSYGAALAWVAVDQAEWPYNFPPVLHWQNMPSIDSAYGRAEIGPDGFELQDRINAVSSNTSKIVRLFAHPKQALVNASAGERVDVGPDQILNITTEGKPGDGFQQYPPNADITGSMQFLSSLRRTLFDITRTVDMDSLENRMGEMTNFGLRVLYQDNLSKLRTKQNLFGEMVEEMGRRLFLMVGMAPQPFDLIWAEVLPVNQAERAQYDQLLLGMGVVSKQTIADQNGLDWGEESARIAAERQAGDTVGSALLRAFNNGQ